MPLRSPAALAAGNRRPDETELLPCRIDAEPAFRREDRVVCTYLDATLTPRHRMFDCLSLELSSNALAD